MNYEKLVVNGVAITPYKRWAYNLMMREANGEKLRPISADAWREVLGFDKDIDVKKAIVTVMSA